MSEVYRARDTGLGTTTPKWLGRFLSIQISRDEI
jgi:hypothetical protein